MSIRAGQGFCCLVSECLADTDMRRISGTAALLLAASSLMFRDSILYECHCHLRFRSGLTFTGEF